MNSRTRSPPKTALPGVWRFREKFSGLYGHLRPGTYDITSPRYDADPEKYINPFIKDLDRSNQVDVPFVWSDQERRTLAEHLGIAGIDITPDELEKFMRKAIEGREYAKFIFTRNLSDGLERLADWGGEHGLDREQVSHLDVELLRSLGTELTAPNIDKLVFEQAREDSRLYNLA